MSKKREVSSPSRIRVGVEMVMAVISVILFAVTLVVPRWIETFTGLDPDNGSGGMELALPVAFAAAGLVFGHVARRDLRRRRRALA